MHEDTQAHYDRLASTYDENWAYSAAFLSWMTDCLLEQLQLGRDDRLLDLGAGTGLYARRLVEYARSVTCVEPSASMLEQIPDDPHLACICASAGQVAAGRVQLPEQRYEAILLKEVLHHVVDRAGVIRGLAALLAPRGRLVVAMLPTSIDYPLFEAAHERFRSLQPDPEDITRMMREAGLEAELTYREFPLSFPTERYLAMVRNRYMSLLSLFTDDELAAGVEEIRRRHPGDTVEFVERFAFVTGRAA